MTQPTPAPDSGEADIIAHVARGDREAFARLYDLYAPRVYGLIVKIVGRTGSDADDLLQDIMFELWRSAAKYNPEAGSPATWILLIARSRAIDHLRKKRTAAGTIESVARRTTEQSAGAPRLPGETGALHRALETLPAEQSQAFTLAFAHGMTREQIAASLDVPVGTIKTRVRTAVQRLSEQGAGRGDA